MALYEVLTYGQCNKSVGGSGSVHRDLVRKLEGRQLKSLCGSKYGVWTGEQPPHSDISQFNACIGPVCVFQACVNMTTE